MTIPKKKPLAPPALPDATKQPEKSHVLKELKRLPLKFSVPKANDSFTPETLPKVSFDGTVEKKNLASIETKDVEQNEADPSLKKLLDQYRYTLGGPVRSIPR